MFETGIFLPDCDDIMEVLCDFHLCESSSIELLRNYLRILNLRWNLVDIPNIHMYV